MHYQNTIKDISRKIAMLDAEALAVELGGAANCAGHQTPEEIAYAVARLLAEQLRRTHRLGKITKRDAGAILASHGASELTIERHAYRIARRIRSYRIELGSWGAAL